MPVDEGDDERWAELPGGGSEEASSSSDSDDGGNVVDHISSLSADDGAAGTLLYPLPSSLPSLSSLSSSASDRCRRILSISHDSTQGLAARVWPSAAMLVEFIAAEVEKEKERREDDDGENNNGPFSWRGASVLELGSGPGLTGIAVAALAGSRVLLTDLEGPALTLARRNVGSNAAEIERGGGSVAVAALPWGQRGAARRAVAEAVSSDPSLPSFFAAPPTAVIAADVIYDGALFSLLLETLEELAFGEGGSASAGASAGGGDNENDTSSSASTRASSSPSSSSPSFTSPRILIAHVRRWKRDARFWAAAKKRFEVLDVTPPGRKSEKAGEGEREREGGGDGADDGEGEQGSSSSKKGLGRRRYSSHEKGALRVFELVPKIKNSRQ